MASAAHITQLLGLHAAQALYQGTSKFSNTVTTTGSQNTNGLWLACSIVTAAGQTEIDRIELPLLINGSGADTIWSLYTNSGTSPGTATGTSVTLPADHLTTTARTVSLPLYATGLTASTHYWIVVQAAGDASNNLAWQTNGTNPGSGVLTVKTSTNGTTWSAVAGTYFMFNQFQGASGVLRNLIEDSAAKTVELTYTNGLVSNAYEYCAGQTGGRFAAAHALSYTNGLLTSVT